MSATIKATPFKLVFAREPKTPPLENDIENLQGEHIENLRQTAKKLRSIEVSDLKAKMDALTSVDLIDKNDLVWWFKDGPNTKFESVAGPFRVVDTSENTMLDIVNVHTGVHHRASKHQLRLVS